MGGGPTWERVKARPTCAWAVPHPALRRPGRVTGSSRGKGKWFGDTSQSAPGNRGSLPPSAEHSFVPKDLSHASLWEWTLSPVPCQVAVPPTSPLRMSMAVCPLWLVRGTFPDFRRRLKVPRVFGACFFAPWERRVWNTDGPSPVQTAVAAVADPQPPSRGEQERGVGVAC